MTHQRRHTRIFTSAAIVLAMIIPIGGATIGTQASAASAHYAAAKKTCKMVTKTVKGKKQRVKVCRNTKPAPKPTPTPVSIPTKPNPTNVSLQLDASKQVSQSISTAGGSISATTTDGTSFTLTVPKDALAADTTITLTPLSGVGGLPLSGGLAAGVQLQPEGLRFYQPATLTITLNNAIPVARQISFAAGGEGQDFHLYPATSTPTKLMFRLNHFSGYGVGQGTAADLVAASQHAPGSWQAQAEQLAALLSKAQQAQADGQPSPFSQGTVGQALTQFVQSRYTQVVLPEMQRAATSDDESVVQKAIQDTLDWSRTVDLAGLDFKREQATLIDLIRQALAHQLELARLRCGTTGHTLIYSPVMGWIIDPEGMNKILALSRAGLLLGFNSPPFLLTIDDKTLDNCRPLGLKFEHVKWHEHVHDADASYGESTTDFEIIQGRVCGAAPGLVWTFTVHEVSNWPLFGNYKFDGIYNTYWDPTKSGFHPHPAGYTRTAWIGGEINPQIYIRIQANPGSIQTPKDLTISAPIVEDRTCPPPAH